MRNENKNENDNNNLNIFLINIIMSSAAVVSFLLIPRDHRIV